MVLTHHYESKESYDIYTLDIPHQAICVTFKFEVMYFPFFLLIAVDILIVLCRLDNSLFMWFMLACFTCIFLTVGL